ncbi:MAG: hypothetical protein AAFQ44_12455 [Pseudomonadota bacterium]
MSDEVFSVWDVIVAHRTFFEVALFGVVMFLAGWFGARLSAGARLRARDAVLGEREQVWRRRHAQAQRDAGSARERVTRERRHHRANIKKLQSTG